jgi:hypothetical protein
MNAAAKPAFTVDAFENGPIDPDAFDHEAHVYVAWLYLERFPLLEAIAKFDAALRRLTVNLGIPGKYHATITWFFMLLIAERRNNEPGSDWFRFRRDNDDLVSNGDILQHYYDSETLASDRARQSFVLPDKLAA